jgi:hypothetical protein
MVSCALAEFLAQLALAATVRMSCVPTALVERATFALWAPTGTWTGPVHDGEPVHPGKVAICAPDTRPPLSLSETVELASLEETARLSLTVAVTPLPPVTVDGVSVTD